MTEGSNSCDPSGGIIVEDLLRSEREMSSRGAAEVSHGGGQCPQRSAEEGQLRRRCGAPTEGRCCECKGERRTLARSPVWGCRVSYEV
jgi:hypothetical protein